MSTELIVRWCNRIIRGGFFFLFALVPLLLTPWNYELFEYNKMMAVYAITVAVVGAWLVKVVAQKEVRITKTPLDLPIILFLLSQLISSFFSMDPHVSWFGYYSRFNGGMWSVISYVLLYYTFVSNWGKTERQKDSKTVRKNAQILSSYSEAGLTVLPLLKVSLSTAAIVALYGVLERLGVDKHLWVQDVQNRVFSTLGQPNWLASYLVALTPLVFAFGLQFQISNFKLLAFGEKFSSKARAFQIRKPFYWLKTTGWFAFAMLLYVVLLFTRSRSGLLSFFVADIVFWGLLYWKTKEKRALRIPCGIWHLACGIILFFNGTGIPSLDRLTTLAGWQSFVSKATMQQLNNLPAGKAGRTIPEATASGYVAPLLESGGTESGTIRKYVWEGAINAWKSSPKTIFIGTGTETFAFAFYQFRPAGHNLTSEWDFLYNKAHNEYLNYLATTGIFGLGSYLLFIVAFIVWFIREQRAKSKEQSQQNSSLYSVPFALFSGWLSVLVTNFFGFSVVVTQLFLFLFPAIIFSLPEKGFEGRVFPLKLNTKASQWTSLTLTLALLALLVLLSRHWYADTLFAMGYRLNRGGTYEQSRMLLSRAVSLNPKEPFYHDELGTALSGLAIVAIEAKNATTAARLAQESIKENDTALIISPKNVSFWKSRTKIFYAFSAFDAQFNTAAIGALERALELSPNDPKILYNLAILFGREGNNPKAIELLKQSISLKRDYRDAYYALSIFYSETKQPDLARSILQEYLDRVDPTDRDFQERIAQ